MTLWLRALCCSCRGHRLGIQHQQPSITLLLGDSASSSDFYRHQTSTLYTYTHAGKTFIRIQFKNVLIFICVCVYMCWCIGHFPIVVLKLGQLTCHLTRMNIPLPSGIDSPWSLLSLCKISCLSKYWQACKTLLGRTLVPWRPWGLSGELILRSLGWTACSRQFPLDSFKNTYHLAFPTVMGAELKGWGGGSDHFLSFRKKHLEEEPEIYLLW